MATDRTAPGGLSLGAYFLIGFSLVGGTLFLVFELTLGRRIERRIVEARFVQLRNIANVTALGVRQYLDDRRVAVERAANILPADGNEEALARALGEIHRLHPQFRTMLVADARGDLLAYSPPVDPQGRPFVPRSRNVADRDYFRGSLARNEAYVTGVFRGRGYATDPIIGVAAPLPLASGVGIVEGSLDLDRFGQTIRVYRTFAGVEALIIDRNGLAVFSSRPDVAVLTPVDATEFARVVRATGPGRPVTLDGGDIAVRAPSAHGFQVLVRASRASIDAEAAAEGATFRTFLATLLGLAVLSAYLIARQVTVRLGQLSVTTESYLRGESSVPASLQRSRLREIRLLAGNFARMFDQLDRAFHEMDGIIHRQEETIAHRTHELRQANDRLQQLATTDELTGLLNFREFSRRLDTSLRVAARDRVTLALLMVDVDYFKRYNDAYGHGAGNECLVRVSRTIASHARRALDVAARYGGEEFALLLFGADRDFAARTAEELRHDIEALAIPHRDSPYGVVTASIGVRIQHPDAATRPEELIHRADEALYTAKRERNSVHVTP